MKAPTAENRTTQCERLLERFLRAQRNELSLAEEGERFDVLTLAQELHADVGDREEQKAVKPMTITSTGSLSRTL